jgi:hypothetical protein
MIMILKNKNFKSILMYFLLTAIVLGFTHCGKDEAEPSPPTISITNPVEDNPVAYPGKFMQLSLTAKADDANGASLSSIEVRRKFETGNAVIVLDESISGSSYSLEALEVQVENEIGSETWTITVSDDKGNSTKKEILVTISGDAPDLSPTLEFKGEPGYQNVNFTIDIGTQFFIGIVAQSNAESGAELEKLIVKKATGTTNPEIIYEKEFFEPQINWDTSFFSSYQPAVETYYFRVVDKNGEFNEIYIIATVEQADMGIYVFEGVQLNSWESGAAAGFNTETGDTYIIPQVTPDMEAGVDFIFARTDTYGYSFFAPESPLVWGIYPSVNSWVTQNKTMFEKTELAVSNYNAIENKNQLILTIQNLAGIGSFNINYFSEYLSNPGGFEVNDIIAFENPSGDRGLMLIKAKDDGPSSGFSSFIFDMKVEKP